MACDALIVALLSGVIFFNGFRRSHQLETMPICFGLLIRLVRVRGQTLSNERMEILSTQQGPKK